MPDDLAARITAMIDGRLPADEVRSVEEAIASDPVAAAQADVERSVVSMLRQRRDRLRMPLPPSVERSVRTAIAAERIEEPTPSSLLSRLTASLRRPLVLIPLMAGVAAVVVTVAVRRADPSDNVVPPAGIAAVTPKFDLQEASYANFAAIVRGDLKLAHESSDTAALQQWFLSQGVRYPVFFPEIAAKLLGGVVSDHDGLKFAHLVYAVDDHLVYLFEVDEASVESKTVGVGPTITSDMAQRRWHWEERSGTGTLFMWKSKKVVCSVVSDLKTNDLSALFTLEDL